MRRIIFALLLSLASTSVINSQNIASTAQEDEASSNIVKDTNIDIIRQIRAAWKTDTLLVENAFPKARIRNFAKAFCNSHPNYPPNAALTDYLRDIGHYSYEEKHYIIIDEPSSGYIKCDMGGQFDFLTCLCYWKRSGGHNLVAVLMQIANEGETCDSELLFYDFNPATSTMLPDLEVQQTVDALLKQHPGSQFIRLPEEGKDISVSVANWSEDEADIIFDDFLLQWTGNTFKFAK